MAFISSLFGTKIGGHPYLLSYSSPRCPITKVRSNKWVSSIAPQPKASETELKPQEITPKGDIDAQRMDSAPIEQASEIVTDSSTAEAVIDSEISEPLEDPKSSWTPVGLAPGVSPYTASAGEYIGNRFNRFNTEFKTMASAEGVNDASYMERTFLGFGKYASVQETRARFRMAQKRKSTKLAELFENRKRAMGISRSSYEESLASRFPEVASALVEKS